jgi:hypothetical protein
MPVQHNYNAALIGGLAFLALALAFSAGRLEAADKTSSQPNIIFILTDDLGYGDLSCYGQQKFRTANIDLLAQEGMRFTQFYSGSTVCAPSRCSLMTDYHTGHVYVRLFSNALIRP